MEKRLECSFTADDISECMQSCEIGFWKIEMEIGVAAKMYVDKHTQAIFGIPDGASPEKCYDFFDAHIHPDDYSRIREYSTDVLRGTAVIEYRYIHPDRGEIRVRCSGKKVKSNGNQITTMGYNQELTHIANLTSDEQNKEKLALRNRDLEQKRIWADDYYKSLLDMVNCGVISYTLPEHRLLHMNAEALRILGVKIVDEVLPVVENMLVRVNYTDEDVINRLKSLQTEDIAVDFECTVTSYVGEQKNIIARSEAFISPQGERCVVTTFIDVSENQVLRNEKTVLEKSLADSIRKNEVIGAISCLYWQVFSVDLKADTYKEVFADGHFVMDDSRYVETAQSAFLGVIYNFASEDYRAELEEFCNHSTLSERLADTNTISLDYLSKAGEWLSARYIVQSRDETGRVDKVLFLMQQIDAQKRKELEYQQQLKQTAEDARLANEAKTNFLRRMSHDIRTPLNGIIGLLNIDKAHFDDMKLVRENHDKMMLSANHLLSLISDVLQMSKLEGGDAMLTNEAVSIMDLTKDVVNIIIGRAVEAGIQWEYEKNKSFIPYPYIYGSPVHLRQIFLNIYGNCIKYNKPGGKITTIVQSYPGEGDMCIYKWIISDTGIGMSQEFLKHIFEPFVQAKNDMRTTYQGIGLGMAIVKALLDQMGGSIDISSEEGVGTTFEITIPFEIAPSPKELEAENEGENIDIHGLRLMLVEDNELNAEIAEMLLSDEGAEIVTVVNGAQAVELFNSNEPGFFDAILMDMMMPVMDGVTATKAIRALGRSDAREIPIIAMTANAFKEDEMRCLAAGMNAHIAKPLDIAVIKKTLKEHVRRTK